MMVSEKGSFPKPLMLSVAFAVKLNVPDAVGVPIIWPLEVSVIPAGIEVPSASDQVYPGVPPVALNVCVGYAALTSPFGREAAATTGAALIVSGSGCIALTLAESVTFTTSVRVAAAAGVPDRRPAGLSERPAGSGGELPSRLHVYGGEPPVAERDTPLGGLYTAVASAGGRELVNMLSGGGAMIIEKPCVAVPIPSATCAVKLNVPKAVGGPALIAPPELKLIPGGSEPENKDHV